MSGVFISYAREDLPFARRLHEALSAAGRDPAWDQDHAVVPFSAPYEAEIGSEVPNELTACRTNMHETMS